MSSYGKAYIPARINYSRCRIHKCPPKEIFYKNSFDSTQTIKYKRAATIKRASKGHGVSGGSSSGGSSSGGSSSGGCTKKNINSLGRWGGGLGGFGSTLKNKF